MTKETKKQRNMDFYVAFTSCDSQSNTSRARICHYIQLRRIDENSQHKNQKFSWD